MNFVCACHGGGGGEWVGVGRAGAEMLHHTGMETTLFIRFDVVSKKNISENHASFIELVDVI